MNDYFDSKKWKSFLKENKKYSMDECGEMPPEDVVTQVADRGAVHHGLEKDHEGEMARSQLMGAQESASVLMDMIQDGDELPAWLQSKLTKAADYLSMARRWMEYKSTGGAPQGGVPAAGGTVGIHENHHDLSHYSEPALEAAKYALEQIPNATERHGAALENEIYTYLEEGFREVKQPEEIFKLADDALAAAGIMLGLGPDDL